MKKFTMFAVLLALGLWVGMIQTNSSSASASTGPVVSQQDPPSSAGPTAKAQTFTGHIGQTEDGRFVLRDERKRAAYLLDDQEKAKQYAGQKVKVMGTLDVATNTIHVSSIEAV